MCEKVEPAKNKLLSKIPSGAPEVILVTVCAAESSFDQVTVPPTSTVTWAGIQHSLVSSHPGTEEPDGILTEADEAANEDGLVENRVTEITSKMMPMTA